MSPWTEGQREAVMAARHVQPAWRQAIEDTVALLDGRPVRQITTRIGVAG